jgi:hypothetical protein
MSTINKRTFLITVVSSVVITTIIILILIVTVPCFQDLLRCPPDYDSGWVTIPDTSTGADILTLTHNLGTKDIIVYMIGKDVWGFTHTKNIGGSWWFPQPSIEAGAQTGAYWVASNDDEISIWRESGDFWNSQGWVSVRCLIWEIPPLRARGGW